MDSTDRISELPIFIIHHILSSLDSYTDLVRTSVLSKKWFALTASFPILDFDVFKMATAVPVIERERPEYPLDNLHLNEKLFEYVTYTLSRFSQHNVRAQTFKLVARLEESTEFDLVDRWIGIVVKKDVQMFEIRVSELSWEGLYRLPNTLLSATSITSLKISVCQLPSSLMVDGVKFKSLKLLSLTDVRIDEQVIKYLTTSCPLIEELDIQFCRGFKRFCVSGHQNLQILRIWYEHDVERVDIQVLDLTYFCIKNTSGRDTHINLASCKKLQTFSFFSDSTMTTKWFTEFLSNFPLLEDVLLDLNTSDKKFKVSSQSVRKFVLNTWCRLEEVELDIPNLLQFQYSGQLKPPLFSLTSVLVKWKKYALLDLMCDIQIWWFQDLRRFFDGANHFKDLELFIRIKTDDVSVDELKVIKSLPYELEQVELSMDNPMEVSSVYKAAVVVVDAVFWCCRPQCLTIRLDFQLKDFEERCNFLKYTYEKLLHQDQCQTHIQIVLSCGSKAKKHFTNLGSLLDALPSNWLGESVTFTTKNARINLMKWRGHFWNGRLQDALD